MGVEPTSEDFAGPSLADCVPVRVFFPGPFGPFSVPQARGCLLRLVGPRRGLSGCTSNPLLRKYLKQFHVYPELNLPILIVSFGRHAGIRTPILGLEDRCPSVERHTESGGETGSRTPKALTRPFPFQGSGLANAQPLQLLCYIVFDRSDY